jgi:large repetitive protein
MKRSVLASVFGLFMLALFGVACGGSGSSTQVGVDAGRDGSGGALDGGGDAIGPSFTISGTASGLAGSGLTLQNGTETIAVKADGAFAFKTPVASGGTYDVTVATQPSMPTQTCTVANGNGTATASVTNVTVTCTTSDFTISGTVVGLAGTGLVLQNNNTDSLTVSADGTFTFATPVASGNAFSVTVMTQPSGPTQLCAVVGGTGKVGSANVTDVMVNCSITDFVIGGQITGLAGGSVVLQDNGGDNLSLSANGTFAFATPVASGANYAVTVLTQPSSPTETCTVSMGAGKVGSANVTSVNVVCSTNAYTIGGTVSGLAGTGLVLQDNGGDNLTVSANGTFTFATSVASGANYAVTVLTQAQGPAQTCAVTMGTGTAGSANVTNVAVTCTTNTYSIGGTLSGIAASDSVVLQDNGGDNLTVSANGTFTFATSVASGATYAVTVLTQPGAPAQTCTVSGGTGTVVAGNVTSVTVNCSTNTYTVGGTIGGLAGTVVLEDNGGDDLSLTTNGTFAFATPIASGMPYAVTVLTQPGAPAQTCVVASGSGSVTDANVTGVTITCTTNTYTVGGTVSGLAANESVVLQDNGGDNLTVNANGTVTFATSVASGQAYAVTALTNPAAPIAQTCAVTNGSGAIGAANVTNVTVTCTTNKYTVGGTVSGLVGTGLVLQDNGGDNLTVTSNGVFALPTSVASGGAYAVTVLTNPTTPWQTCVVGSGSGTVTSANVTSVTVTCTTNKYTVGGTVTGLGAGDSLVVQDNGASNLTVNANGTFTLPSLASGTNYAVTVLSQSGATAQTCTVSGGTGLVGGANVTSVAINCTTNKYTIGGTVSGLAGTGLVLQDNGADNLTVSANGTFSLATPIASGATYAVTVLTNPTSPTQTCVVTNGTGTVAAANVTSVTVTCTTNTYTIGGTLGGLAAGDSVVLQDNGANNLTLGANGTFTFTTAIPSGGTYAVTVLTNPANPSQSCVVTSGGGSVINANISSVVVTCTTTACAAGTLNHCVLTPTNSGSTDTGTCAAGFTGSCSFSCSNATFTQVTDTCAPFVAHNITDATSAYMAGRAAGDIYKVNASTGVASLLTSGGPTTGFTMAFNPSNGTLYAGTQGATSGTTPVYSVNTTSGALTLFATLPVNPGDWICGLWFDPSGNMYFNSSGNTTVYKVTTAGVVSTFISGDGHLSGISTQGTSDNAGNLYIASRSGSMIFKYSAAGTWISTLTTSCAPWGVAVASDGNLLYTCDDASVHELNVGTLANSTFATLTGGQLGYLSVDPTGDVYVGQFAATTAWKLSPAGATLWSVTLAAGSGSAF